MNLYTDDYFMKEALKEAHKAFDINEVPVGAVLVHQNQIIARTHNQSQLLNDFTAHAEMLAFSAASSYFGGKYLDKCRLFVTLEPCLMCTGASYWTQLGELIYAATDPKKGMCTNGTSFFHPKTKLSQGPFKHEAEQLLKLFFEQKR
ncbi:MAG: nucleoside deaminase [Flavobacteriales bacterium]